LLIDWFTVGAQALNFVILVWLMRRFLYKPILDAIDARERKIASELADARAKQAEAQKQRAELQHENDELDQQRAELMKKATNEANAEGQRLLQEASQAAEALSKKRQQALETDARDLNQAIARRAQQEVFAIARKALSELATTSLEESMTRVFIERLPEMDAPTKATLAAAVRQSTAPLVLSSAFELAEQQRAVLQDALNRAFSAEVRLRFETAPTLISGIELAYNGHKLAWSIADYLGALEKSVEALVKEKAKLQAEPKTEAKPQPKPSPIPEANSA
jgi:F-type H+-transporting ATPase subunit b